MVRKASRSIQLKIAVPDDLTDEFIAKIMSLRSSPKTDYLKANFLNKFVSDDTAPADVRRVRAINKWLATEMNNSSTNERLLLTHEEYNILPRVSWLRFVSFCRDLVSEIIGDTVPLDALIGAFSGGASTSRSRTESLPGLKYLGRAHVTESCLRIFQELVIPEVPGWLSDPDLLSLDVVPGNVLFTVPKNADIDRCACKEPDVNMFVQKGIGSYFRKCLRRIGINLNDQSINSSLARIGSIDGSLATLDLSSASDSVTTGLVALLLPECWYTFLDAVRSPVTIIDGEVHRNEMFSSMGNGFTFELESLLFYVLSRATAYFRGISGVVSVYGDDIICPSELAADLEWVLSYFGFSINTDKSFIAGPIRESCGGHYYNGTDITPFYLRSKISSLLDLIHTANQLREWSRIEGLSILNPETEAIWLWLKSFVPEELWGGDNTAFKYQLVSNDKRNSRLYEDSKKRDVGIGAYYHWLNTTWDRQSLLEVIETSYPKVSLGRIRIRRCREQTVPRLDAIFHHEI